MNSRNLQQWASIAAGVLAAAAGIRRGGRQGMMLAVAGTALGVVVFVGAGRRRNVFGRPRSPHWQLPRDRLMEDASAFGRAGSHGADVVHEASDESFPASDAPSFTPTTSIGKHESN